MSFRYPAGLITASSPVNANYPSGVWTPRQALPYLQNGVWGQDPFFDQTVLLLHGDGTNGAQNNTFLDSSSNNFTITRNGNTTQGTFTPFSLSAGYWSNYFDGAGDTLTSSSTAHRLDAAAFTIEMWLYSSPIQGTYGILGRSSSIFPYPGYLLEVSNNKIRFRTDDSTNGTSSLGDIAATTCPINQWFHLAIVREGTGSNQAKMYFNGVLVATSSMPQNLNDSNTLTIGSVVSAGTTFLGYMSNLRIVKGTAVYTSDFTPPTTPLTAITNTQLLTCQSNRFVDNSANNLTLTRNGDTRVTPFSPFQPLLAYSPGVTGGSGYFDGNTDYLSIADNAAFQYGSGDFTIEAWVYRTASANQQIIGSHEEGTAASWLLAILSNNKVRLLVNNSTSLDSSGTVPLNTWSHIVAIRNGNNLFLYINGVAEGSLAFSTSINSNPYPITIGADQNGDEVAYSGYIGSLRIVKGQALTTGAFTPPTTPVTTSAVGWTGANVAASITGTVSLLCNFTNAGILDNTAKNVLETVGNAQIDTAVVKYGTGSMEFDGSGDWLRTPSSPDLDLGTGAATVECWLYITAAIQDYRVIVSDATNGFNYVTLRGGGTGGRVEVQVNNTGYQFDLNNSISQNTWAHLAVVRSGNTFTVYVNGSSLGTATSSAAWNLGNGGMFVGRWGGATAYEWPGYIDDLRITKGIARYTANFVPPVARFPNQ